MAQYSEHMCSTPTSLFTAGPDFGSMYSSALDLEQGNTVGAGAAFGPNSKIIQALLKCLLGISRCLEILCWQSHELSKL